jgi:rhodanese-related sulfurtransferase
VGLFLHRVMALVALGLLAGVVHSCASPPKLHPDNNPEPVVPETAPANGTTTEPQKPVQPPGEAPAKPAEAPKVDPPPVSEEAAKPAPNYFITIEKAKELFDRGKRNGSVYFVDARNPEQYAQGHVAGAMSILPGAFGGPIRKATEYLPGMTVVVYCVGRDCTDSEAVMLGLQNLKKSIGPIYIMHDGYQAWADAGHPTERGADPLGP